MTAASKLTSKPEQEGIEGSIRVGVSSCLLGERVRFDGGHKNSRFVSDQLSRYFELEGFCPELDIGLGIPREPIRLILQNDLIECVGTNDPDKNYTEALYQSALLPTIF